MKLYSFKNLGIMNHCTSVRESRIIVTILFQLRFRDSVRSSRSSQSSESVSICMIASKFTRSSRSPGQIEVSRPAGSFVIGVRVVFPYDRSDRLNIISDEHMQTSLFRNNIYKNNEVKICPKIRNHIRSKCIFLLTKQNS